MTSSYYPHLEDQLGGSDWVDAKIERFLTTIRSMDEFEDIEFIILYGSAARGKTIPGSDIDLCIFYNVGEALSRLRLELLQRLESSVYDIQMFQQLPLYVRTEVLKGTVLYAKDMRFIYQVALDTIREFESFKPRFHDYIYR